MLACGSELRWGNIDLKKINTLFKLLILKVAP